MTWVPLEKRLIQHTRFPVKHDTTASVSQIFKPPKQRSLQSTQATAWLQQETRKNFPQLILLISNNTANMFGA